MNKRANIYLNIYSIIFFLLALSLIGLSITLGEISVQIPTILKDSTFILGIISCVLYISIELFLFILMTNKYRLIDITLLVTIGISAVVVNSFFPFIGFLIFMLIPTIKTTFRISKVDKIYIPKEFNRYCKLLNIKVRDFPKKRKTTSKSNVKKFNDEVIKIGEEQADSKTKNKRNKKTVKSYSQ